MLASTFSHKKKAKKTEENAKKAGEGGGKEGISWKQKSMALIAKFFMRVFSSLMVASPLFPFFLHLLAVVILEGKSPKEVYTAEKALTSYLSATSY